MNDRIDFTYGSIPRKLIRFMLPVLGALILQAMYSAVDMIIVGHFGTNEGISGVTTGSNIMNIVTFTVCGLTTGVTVAIGQCLGEKQTDRMEKLIGSAVWFFVIISIIITVILVVLARPLALLMQAPEEALTCTVSYIRICGVGYIFIVFYNLISGILRGMGNSNLPLLFVGIACVVNVLGDLLLVAVLDLNVAGAAIATVGAQAVSVILSLLILKKKNIGFRLRLCNIRNSNETKAFLNVGFPMAVHEFLSNGSFLALCAFINVLGLEASSGYGVAQKLVSFILLVPSSLMQTMAAVVAQNVGAQKEKRALKCLLWGISIGACIGVFMGLFVFLRGDLAAKIFTDNLAFIEKAFEYLRGFAPEAVVTSILFGSMGYFNAHSMSRFVLVQGVAQSLLVRLPVSYFMSIRPNANLTMIGLAAPAATIFGITLCILYFLYLKKTGKIVIVDAE